LTIQNGKIKTVAGSAAVRINRAFDLFLNSLSKDSAAGIIAVVLSGGGDDGVAGINGSKTCTK